VFCRLNYLWGKWFRKHAIIKRNPVFEVFLIVAATALLQYPNPLIREPGDVMIKNLLIDCRNNGKEATNSWICRNEAQTEDSITNSNNWHYTAWLAHGTLAKLFLTIITFGIKVPSGVIIPSLDAGALFGRLIGQYIPSSSSSISPGIFAMVGAAAFLAGVSRMTISLCVIMFELTGELEYVIPHMLAILVAKWTADALSKEGVYDLAQSVLGHPFLDLDHSMGFVQQQDVCVEALIPPQHTMQQITLHVPSSNKVARNVLQEKLAQLQNRGLMDAGLVLVQHDHMLQGYIGQGELDFGLSQLGTLYPQDAATQVRLLGDAEEGDFDLSGFVDRTPLVLCAKAPMEYAVEMFAKLGLRHLMVTEEGSGRLVGVIIKKRLVAYLDELKHQE
jgi:chloride channel 3/4/5